MKTSLEQQLMGPKYCETLLNLYIKKKLAPFYIIRPSSLINEKEVRDLTLKNWVTELCAVFLSKGHLLNDQQIQDLLSLGHEDIVFINRPSQSDYTFEIKDFQRVNHHGPRKLNHKLIFVFRAEEISDIHLNKWLKTLEDPIEGISTFFIVDGQRPLLNTIESRAITFRISSEEHFLKNISMITNFKDFLKQNNSIENLNDDKSLILDLLLKDEEDFDFFELSSQIKNDPHLINWLIDNMSHYILGLNIPVIKKQEWIDEMQWFQKSKTYHNSADERLYRLINVVRTT